MLFVSVKTSDLDDYYIVPLNEAALSFEAELENHLAMNGPGLTLTFEIVEMSEQEYMKLPEFEGKTHRGGYCVGNV